MSGQGGALVDGGGVDVAVVGAGVSGTYLCWRLKKDGGRDPILFEMSDRVGGRLWSFEFPGMPDLRAELGGMRFLTSQLFVVNLVKQLGLKTAPFPTGGPQNFAALRRRLLRNKDFTDPSKVPYWLQQDEQGENPGDLLVKAIETVVPGATNLTPKEWEHVKQTRMWRGRHLYDWGFWNVLLQVLSSEAYALLLEGGGYESLTDNWNCAEACEYLLMDFPRSVEYKRLVEGFQALPSKLASEFEHLGGHILKNQRLTAFKVSPSDEYPVELTLKSRAGRALSIRAKALVLAMPQRSLKLLAETTAFLRSADVPALLDTVTAMPAFKVLLGYDNPWWRNPPLGLTEGRSTTDLPLRQVYYAGTEADYGPSNRNSLVLASYADGRAESFWRPLAKGPKLQMQAAYAVPADVPGVPAALAETLDDMLAEMHGLQELPPPYWGAYKDWTDDPYGGGWHFWNVGAHAWETIPAIRQPQAAAPVYICGESYTNEQGWVEGALNSAEHVLEDHFQLARPSWLPADYYLGP